MSDEELIARLLDWEEYDEGDINDAREAAANRIEAQAAEIERLRGDLAKALDALHEAWFMLTAPMLNYEPEPEEPGLRRIKDTLTELTGAQKDGN